MRNRGSKTLLSRELHELKKFETHFRQEAIRFKQLKVLLDEYFICFSDNKWKIVEDFEDFFIDGLDYNNINRKEMVTKMGGDNVILRVIDLIDFIEDLSLHRDVNLKNRYVANTIYTYIDNPLEICYFERIKGVSQALKELRVEKPNIETVLDIFKWDFETKTLDTKAFYKFYDKIKGDDS